MTRGRLKQELRTQKPAASDWRVTPHKEEPTAEASNNNWDWRSLWVLAVAGIMCLAKFKLNPSNIAINNVAKCPCTILLIIAIFALAP